MSKNKTPKFPWFYNCGLLKPCKMVWSEVPYEMFKQEGSSYAFACYRRDDYYSAVGNIRMKYKRMKERGDIE